MPTLTAVSGSITVSDIFDGLPADTGRVTYGTSGNTFTQNADQTYTSATRTATATFTIGGTTRVEVITATLGTDGNVDISTTTNVSQITQTLFLDGTQTPVVEFDGGTAAVAASFRVQQVAPQVTKASDIVTINSGGTTTTITPPIIGTVSYTNRNTFIRAANEGAWTPTDTADVIETTAEVAFTRGSTVVARIARKFSYNTGTSAFTVTTATHSGGDLNTSRVTPTVSSTSLESVITFAYSNSGETSSARAEVDIIVGGSKGDNGNPGLTFVERYARFPTDASAVSPTSDNGLGDPWYSDPDLVTDGYTHTTRRGGTFTTIGQSTEVALVTSGSGGGSYQSARPEIYSLTGLNSSIKTSTVDTGTAPAFEFGVTGATTGGDFDLVGTGYVTTQTSLVRLADGYVYITRKDGNVIRSNDGFVTFTVADSDTDTSGIAYSADLGEYVTLADDTAIYSQSSLPVTTSGRTQEFDDGIDLYDVILIAGSTNRFIAVGDGEMYRSDEDSAGTWSGVNPQNSGTLTRLLDLDGPSVTRTFCFKDGNTPVSSSNVNGRGTWVGLTGLTSPQGMSYNNVDEEYLTRSGIVLLKSTDGIAFSSIGTVTGLTTQSNSDIYFEENSERYITVDGDGVYRSSNSAATSWSQVSTNGGGNGKIVRDGNGNLIIYHSNGLLRSSDNGANWTVIPTGTPTSVSFTLPADEDALDTNGSAYGDTEIAGSVVLTSGLSTEVAINADIVTKFNALTTDLGLFYVASLSTDGDVLLTGSTSYNTTGLIAGTITSSLTIARDPDTSGVNPAVGSTIAFNEVGGGSTMVQFSSQVTGTAVLDSVSTALNSTSFPYTFTGSGLVRTMTSESSANLPDVTIAITNGTDGNIADGTNLVLAKTQEGITANTLPASGAVRSVLTLTKSGGERNGTATVTLGYGATFASEQSSIEAAAKSLFLRAVVTNSTTLTLFSIEQEPVTISASVAAGVTPAGDAAVAITVTRAGTDPILTIIGDGWSNPINNGIQVS